MSYNLENLQILLVEDNLNMRALVRAMLRALGFETVRDCANGQQAIEMLQQFTPDIIVSDWMMEPVDGMDLTKFVRNSEESPDAYIPVILMTGHTERWRILAARDTGVNELLAKPISARTLYDRILAVIEKPRPFVRTKSYFGPCRRRTNWQDYLGPERRQAAQSVEGASVQAQEIDRLLESL